jgi:hypothetical protein
MDAISKSKKAGKTRGSGTLSPPKWAADLVRRFEREFDKAQEATDYVLRKKVEEFPAGAEMLKRPRQEWPELIVALASRLKELRSAGKLNDGEISYECIREVDAIKVLIDRLLIPRLSFDAPRFAAVIDVATKNIRVISQQGRAMGWNHVVPRKLLVQQIEHHVDSPPAVEPMASAVRRLGDALKSRDTELFHRIRRLLSSGEITPESQLRKSPWQKSIVEAVSALSAGAAVRARKALALALAEGGKAKPSEKWLVAARAVAKEDAKLLGRVVAWIKAHEPQAAHPDPNEDTIRGLIWFTAAFGDDQVASALGRYCELCFSKVPEYGANSVKLGNAAIMALEILGSVPAVAELSRLKTRVRYPTALRRLDQALQVLATKAGVTADDLEEMALPTFELSREGERRVDLKGGAALLRITGSADVTIEWEQRGGKRSAAVPKALKDADPDGVKAARAIAKEIAGILAGQGARLESCYLAERHWPLSVWRQRYLEHPLMRGLAMRLIWRFEQRGKANDGLPRANGIEDVTGKPLAIDDDATVRLWHPLFDPPQRVLAWRERLASLGITQPFKQAHRELYVVTDAERATNTYSNRFAAHILRQHQFKALANQRRWRYSIMGAWDSHNTPTRALPWHNMTAEFWVDGIPDAEETAAGIYTIIATDQVRFVRENAAMPVADVPPLVFSEIMRDVDLFVGVASVGNDPSWVDGGPAGRHRDYWAGYAFGELAAQAQSRAEVLQRLLPRLAIAERCRIDGRFLVVEGRQRRYKIHIGSGNILMAPNDSYLCIVPGRGAAERKDGAGAIALPFEGDGMLAIVLSKAFLLAADDKITDPSIQSQIDRGR